MKVTTSALCLVLFTLGCRSSKTFSETIFQVSTMDSLKAGNYDGLTTFSRLKKRGDFGLGTFEGLDGELILLDGQYYQVKADGLAYPVTPSMKTPFVDVTLFKADQIVSLKETLNYEQLAAYIDRLLPNKDAYYAIKIEGRFNYLKTRSVNPQEKPYPMLSEALAGQVIFEYEQMQGTMVGFRTPEAAEGLSSVGYHFHFISADKMRGGHVLACTIGDVKIAIDYSDNLKVLPRD